MNAMQRPMARTDWMGQEQMNDTMAGRGSNVPTEGGPRPKVDQATMDRVMNQVAASLENEPAGAPNPQMQPQMQAQMQPQMQAQAQAQVQARAQAQAQAQARARMQAQAGAGMGRPMQGHPGAQSNMSGKSPQQAGGQNLVHPTISNPGSGLPLKLKFMQDLAARPEVGLLYNTSVAQIKARLGQMAGGNVDPEILDGILYQTVTDYINSDPISRQTLSAMQTYLKSIPGRVGQSMTYRVGTDAGLFAEMYDWMRKDVLQENSLYLGKKVNAHKARTQQQAAQNPMGPQSKMAAQMNPQQMQPQMQSQTQMGMHPGMQSAAQPATPAMQSFADAQQGMHATTAEDGAMQQAAAMPEPVEVNRIRRAPMLESAGVDTGDYAGTRKAKQQEVLKQKAMKGDSEALADWLRGTGLIDYIAG